MRLTDKISQPGKACAQNRSAAYQIYVSKIF